MPIKPSVAVKSWEWKDLKTVARQTYDCGWCGTSVGPDRGWYANYASSVAGRIFLCPTCNLPTFIGDSKQVPAPRLGRDVRGITNAEVLAAYEEARDCTAAEAYTAAALLCRKILMNLAVAHGATAGLNFTEYVTYLEQKGYVPPNGRKWVDRIRSKGNEATHEIHQTTKEEASELLVFVEMLLRFSYEFQSLVP